MICAECGHSIRSHWPEGCREEKSCTCTVAGQSQSGRDAADRWLAERFPEPPEELAPLPNPGELCPHGVIVEESGWLACNVCLTPEHLFALWPVAFNCRLCGIGRAFFAKDATEALELYAKHLVADHEDDGLDTQLARFYVEHRP